MKVDIPRRDPATESAPKSENDEEEEPTVPITISGPASLAEDVRAEIQAIVSSKRSKSTQRVKEVPSHIAPFITSQQDEFAAAEDVNVSVNEKEGEVTVVGEREAVIKTVEAIKARIAELNETLESTTMTIPKRQHRLFYGFSAVALLAKTRCVVIPVAPTEPGDEITIWGLSDDLSGALGAVFEQSRSKNVVEVALPGPIAYASQVRTYVTRSGYLRTLLSNHPGVEVHISPAELSEKTGTIHVDFISEDKAKVEAAKKDMGVLIRNLESALREVEVDWLVHKTLIGRHGKKYVSFQPLRSGTRSLIPRFQDQAVPGATQRPTVLPA